MLSILVDKTVDNYNNLSIIIHNIVQMLYILVDVNVDKFFVYDYN
ncbi:hypothetical protein SDC9_159855 [bioreactor metagenome]|uniref:Uncharacterized protein n=1 Tax=bioreactor metagenome TaxID=1076179 RepID=A0A645FE02_9ZZZZ